MVLNKCTVIKIINGLRMGLINFVSKIYKKNIKKIKLQKNFFIEIEISNKYILSLFYFFKKHNLLSYNTLTDIVCFETLNSDYRYVLIYNLLNLKTASRIFLKSKYKELNINLLSISSLYYTANWLEREIYDFFGLFFNLNKDLRRILLDYGFKGYPLRKDFPLSGFLELFYDDTTKKIAYDKLLLAQEYRIFFFNKNSIGSKNA